MGGNAVKTIVLLMVLVVLSLLVGTQVSDGLKDSVGAFAVIAGVVGGFLLLFLGKNVWWLIFLLPPILNVFGINALRGSLGAYGVAGLILCFNLIQSVFLRQYKLTWHKLWPFDALFAIIVLYMCISYYRYPVFLEIMGDDVEVVGAAPYIVCLGAVVYYFALSSLPITSAELEKILRWVFWWMIAMELVHVIFRYVRGDVYWSPLEGLGVNDGEIGIGERRITLLTTLAGLLLPYCYAALPFAALLRSPIRLFGILFSLYGISLAGARGIFLYTATSVMGISWIKREMGISCLLGLAVWGGCIALGSNGTLQNAPSTLQRILSILPGVQVDSKISSGAEASSEVRVIAWKMAFDTRAGYIKDYVWGDGFQESRKVLERGMVASMRGVGQGIGLERGNDMLARTGMWHNYFITIMHRLGVVGCVLSYCMMLMGAVLAFIIGRYYLGKPFFAYFCALGAFPVLSSPIGFFFSAGIVPTFFHSFVTLVLLKLLYALLREEGKLPQFSLSRSYVPMVIREHSLPGASGEGRVRI